MLAPSAMIGVVLLRGSALVVLTTQPATVTVLADRRIAVLKVIAKHVTAHYVIFETTKLFRISGDPTFLGFGEFLFGLGGFRGGFGFARVGFGPLGFGALVGLEL